MKACRKKTKSKMMPSDKSKQRKGSRQHAEWHVVCHGGPYHCERVMVHVMAWHVPGSGADEERLGAHGLPEAIIGLGGGWYELICGFDDDPRDVIYEWHDEVASSAAAG